MGDVTFLGQRDYSMRAWLDPEKLATRNMTADDVVTALKEQNVQVAAGQVGQPPVPTGPEFSAHDEHARPADHPAQFGDIVLKTDPERAKRTGCHGGPLHDVARLELAPNSTTNRARSTPSRRVALSIYQLPGSNAIQTAKAVYDKMEELKARCRVS